MKIKVSYFISHPIQYFSPLLREIAKVFDLQVYYFSDASIKGKPDKGFGQNVKWDIPLLEGYKSVFLRNFSFRQSLTNRLLDAVNPGVVKFLHRDGSKIVIVNGWTYFSTLLTIITAKIMGKQVWLRGENPLSQELKKSKKVLFVKKIVLRYLLFRLIDKFLYIGKESKFFFEYYGVPASRLVYTPYAVDNNFFDEQYKKFRNDVPQIRKALNLPENKTIILFSGKYIEQKRPMDLIQAFEKLNDASIALVMVGEGRLRPRMEAYIKENNVQGVILTGFINQSLISQYYMAADIFVMCSGMGETWGLSVNEAMNFAKPVVVSGTCGCSTDLVLNGENGFVFEEGNIDALSDSIKKLVDDPLFRTRAGSVSKQIIEEFSITGIVDNISKILLN